MRLHLTVIAIMTLLFTIVKSAVIGIDFGSNFYKISLIAPGKSFVIVESLSTKRKVYNALSFTQNKRQYDAEAYSKKVRFPSNSFPFVNKFLGAIESDEETFAISKEYYDDFIYSFDRRGGVQFELKNFQFDEQDDEDTTIILKVEEVVAQIFKFAKMLSEKMAQQEIKDCVITVPVHWKFPQREALLTAAELSGLAPLNLISENTAAALYYGIDRIDSEEKHTVLYYNLGANNLQASLVEYKAINNTKSTNNSTKFIETVNVLADHSISNVGGMAYDKVIADYFAEIIDAKPDRQGKKSAKENGKMMRKLLRECVRTKEILSANKEAQFYSEGLVDGNDFQASISRELFYERAKHLTDQLLTPVDEVLRKSGKTIEDIDAIELLGGGSRIPVVQTILQERVGSLELGNHLNGDEAMALGASFHGANFSHSFRVKDVQLSDGYNFEVKATIKNLNETEKDSPDYYYKNFTLFTYKKRFGTKKSVTLTQSQNLQIQLYTVDFDGNESPYAEFNLTNVDRILKDKYYNETLKTKVHLEFQISSLEGIVLNDAVTKFNYTYTSKLPKKEVETIINGRESAVKKAEKQRAKILKKAEDPEAPEVQEALKNVTVDIPPLKAGIYEVTEKDGETEKVIFYKSENKTRSINVDIKETYYGYIPLNKTETKKSTRLVKRFDLYEERQRNLSDTKNKYESFVYQIRDWVVDEYFMKYSKEDQLQDLIVKRDAGQEWLDTDEAYYGNITIYQAKIQELEDLAYPTLRRLEEARLRNEYVNKTIEAITMFQQRADQLEKDHKWLNETQLEPVKTAIQDFVDWFKKALDEQKEKALNEDPAFSVHDLKPKVDEINVIYQNVKAIQEPKKEDKKSKKDKKKGFEMPKKQTITVDGEQIEIGPDFFGGNQKFKDFDWAKFEENMKKEQEKKKREDEQQEKKDAENADREEDVDIEDNNEQQQQEEQKQEQKEQKINDDL